MGPWRVTAADVVLGLIAAAAGAVAFAARNLPFAVTKHPGASDVVAEALDAFPGIGDPAWFGALVCLVIGPVLLVALFRHSRAVLWFLAAPLAIGICVWVGMMLATWVGGYFDHLAAGGFVIAAATLVLLIAILALLVRSVRRAAGTESRRLPRAAVVGLSAGLAVALVLAIWPAFRASPLRPVPDGVRLTLAQTVDPGIGEAHTAVFDHSGDVLFIGGTTGAIQAVSVANWQRSALVAESGAFPKAAPGGRLLVGPVDGVVAWSSNSSLTAGAWTRSGRRLSLPGKAAALAVARNADVLIYEAYDSAPENPEISKSEFRIASAADIAGSVFSAAVCGDHYHDLALSPDATLVALGCEEQVIVIDRQTNRTVASFEVDDVSNLFNPMRFTDDGRHLIVRDGGRFTVLDIDGQTKSDEPILTLPNSGVPGMSPSGSVIVAPWYDNRFQVWDTAAGTVIGWGQLDAELRSAALHPSLNVLVTVDRSGAVRRWNVADLLAKYRG